MSKRIAFDNITEIMNDYYPETDTVEWRGVEITVRRIIPIEWMSEIVKRVENSCFSDDGEFTPETMEFGIRVCVIAAYTNIDIPLDMELQNRLVFGTDLWDAVVPAISGTQLQEIYSCSMRRVQARTEANRAEFEHEIKKATDMIAELGEKIGDMFNDITPEDVKKMIAAIGENGIDEDRLVQAVVAEQNKTRGNNVIDFPMAEDADHEGV